MLGSLASRASAVVETDTQSHSSLHAQTILCRDVSAISVSKIWKLSCGRSRKSLPANSAPSEAGEALGMESIMNLPADHMGGLRVPQIGPELVSKIEKRRYSRIVRAQVEEEPPLPDYDGDRWLCSMIIKR